MQIYYSKGVMRNSAYQIGSTLNQFVRWDPVHILCTLTPQ